MEVAQVHRPKELEQKNGRLKCLVAGIETGFTG